MLTLDWVKKNPNKLVIVTKAEHNNNVFVLSPKFPLNDAINPMTSTDQRNIDTVWNEFSYCNNLFTSLAY